MHFETVRAPVDLRGAQTHQFSERFFDAALADTFFQREHRFDCVRTGFVEVETLFHDSFLIFGRCAGWRDMRKIRPLSGFVK